MNQSIILFTILGVCILIVLWYMLRRSYYEPFAISDLNTLLNQKLVPNNLTGDTHASLYKKIALTKPDLENYWKTVSNPTAQLLFDDRTELLQMISCFAYPALRANLAKFFKTVDYYTEYFETTDSNFSNIKQTLIEPKIKAFSEKNNKIHGPMILLVWQSPNYIMKEGVAAIRNANIGSLDYNYQPRYPLTNTSPIHFTFYLIAPLHRPDGLPDPSRTKLDICSRLLWLKTLASTDNNCFIRTPGDSAGTFGGCKNLYPKESWQCLNTTLNGIYRRNAANNFECLTVDKKTCTKLNNSFDCENILRSYSQGILVTNEEEKTELNQILPSSDYVTSCMGPGSGVETDREQTNYGIAYFINPNFTTIKDMFDDLAIYPFDESRIGKCPKDEYKPPSILDILRKDAELLIDSEVDIVSITNPNIPKNIDFNRDVIYTISYWIYLANYHPWWRNIFLHGSNNENRAPGMFIWPGAGNLHVGQASDRGWNEMLNSKTALSLNQWYHVTLMANVNKLSLYVNGVLEDEIVLSGNQKLRWTYYGSPMNRMNYNLFPHNYFTSGNRIKQFRWFNRVLTKDEVNNLRYL